MSSRTILWAAMALLGIVATAALAWSASQLAGQHIGLASEPFSVAGGLAPKHPPTARERPDEPRRPAIKKSRPSPRVTARAQSVAPAATAPVVVAVPAATSPPAATPAPSSPTTTSPSSPKPTAAQSSPKPTAAQSSPTRHQGDDSSDSSGGGGRPTGQPTGPPGGQPGGQPAGGQPGGGQRDD